MTSIFLTTVVEIHARGIQNIPQNFGCMIEIVGIFIDILEREARKINQIMMIHAIFPDFKYCTTHWDRISCWPLTRANQFAIISCFAELSDVQYDTTRELNHSHFLILKFNHAIS